MPAQPGGIEDRITSICQANIFPPVQPEIGNILDNQRLPGHVVVVLRIPESKDAPHAINNGRRIYERVGSQNDGCDFAHVDRIQQLLRRRQLVEAQREKYTQEAIERSLRQMTDPLPLSVRWVAAVPYYPWRDLCDPRDCREAEDLLHRDGAGHSWFPQRVPDGVFVLGQSPESRLQVTAARSLNCKGHAFALEWTLETVEEEASARLMGSSKIDRWIRYDHTKRFALNLFGSTAMFYRRLKDGVPGHLALSLGFLNVLNTRMHKPLVGQQGQRFLDPNCRADLSVPSDLFLNDLPEVTKPLFERLAFGFDLPPE